MRYLRMLSNAVIGGALLACYLLSLFLLLNPSLPFDRFRPGRLELTVMLFYGALATATFFALTVARQLLSARILSPGWLSQGVLVWVSAAAAALAAVTMWLNLDGFGPVLGPDVAGRMSTAAAWLIVCASGLLLIALYGSAFTRRRGLISLALFCLTIGASIVMPLAARGSGGRGDARARLPRLALTLSAPPPRVAMLLLDGGSLDFISPAVAEGRLPNFGRILDAGAVMHLATLRPTQPLPVWTAVATGKLPYKNGIRSAATYTVPGSAAGFELLPDFCFAHGLVHFGLLLQRPHSSSDVRAQTLWSIAGGSGITVGIVGWPLTHPARPVRGYLVTDRFHHRDESLTELDGAFVYPPEDFITAAAAASGQPDRPLGPVLPTLELRLPDADSLAPALKPLVMDREYEEAADRLQERYRPQLSAVRFQGLDVAGHYFLRYASPQRFGDVSVSEEERQRYGGLLEQYYAYVDGVLGRTVETLGPDDLLLVVSAFGMEPLSLGKRLLERALGNPELSGSHEGAPDGFLLAYGSAVSPARLRRGSVLDVAPTVLYFLGLPVGRDMDGFARADVFSRDFSADRPITYIPTYDADAGP